MAYGMHDSKGTITVQRICAVPMNGTAYDCSEHWGMVYFQDMYSIQSPEHEWLSGYAVHGEWVKDGEKWSICKFFPKIRESADKENCSIKWFATGKLTRDSCWDEICYPLIWHEMKHLACECQWHENMTSTNTIIINIGEVNV